MVKMNLKISRFPTTPLIEVHSYENERIWNKIAPLKEVPHYRLHFRGCTVYSMIYVTINGVFE